MGDAAIEGRAQQVARRLERVDPAEIVPQAQRQHGKLETAAAAAAVFHGVVAVRGRQIGHFHLINSIYRTATMGRRRASLPENGTGLDGSPGVICGR